MDQATSGSTSCHEQFTAAGAVAAAACCCLCLLGSHQHCSEAIAFGRPSISVAWINYSMFAVLPARPAARPKLFTDAASAAVVSGTAGLELVPPTEQSFRGQCWCFSPEADEISQLCHANSVYHVANRLSSSCAALIYGHLHLVHLVSNYATASGCSKPEVQTLVMLFVCCRVQPVDGSVPHLQAVEQPAGGHAAP
jgi:hypothetical protein